ncbi:PspA/IM30 family protein [Amycolatopsis pigmentata]|uniref:PspA/IM30 family protein n=1 Tax=Amycolatopsis pigmentata TaxID=450801 RepID=A0ABW5FPZ1_9PSEU
MGLFSRIAALFKMKVSKALDRAEDPREVLDYSYEKQLEMLTKVNRGLADVATSRRRIELQIGQLNKSADLLTTQATKALAAGQEDLAREALTRRAAITTQVGDLEDRRQAVGADEEKLKEAAQRLKAKIEDFRTRKETIKASYTAAEAQTRIGEAVSGISEEMGDVGVAMRRAEDRTAQLEARAGALDELLASGALDDATRATERDDIQAQLDELTRGGEVEAELARMKAQLPASAVKRELPPSSSGSS